MSNKKLDAGFSTYCSNLDGENTKVIEITMCSMVEKGLLPKLPMPDCDLIIQKISDFGKTYAMDMFFNRASDEGLSYGVLMDTCRGCFLWEEE